jgi:hypothetical protein
VGGPCKRLRRCFGVADLGIDHDVRQVIVEARGTELDRGQGVRHRRQRLILYDHLFGSILCRRRRLGDDEGDGRPDVAHAIGREDVVWRDGHRRAVAVVQHDIGRSAGSGKMGNAWEAVGRRIRAGQNCDHPGHGACRFGVDCANPRVRMRRAHDRAVGLSRQIEIVAITAEAGEEARILLAPYRVSDACSHGDDCVQDRPRVGSHTLTAPLRLAIVDGWRLPDCNSKFVDQPPAEPPPKVIKKNPPRCFGPRGSDIIERADCSLFLPFGFGWPVPSNKLKDRYPMIRLECADS